MLRFLFFSEQTNSKDLYFKNTMFQPSLSGRNHVAAESLIEDSACWKCIFILRRVPCRRLG